MLNIIIPIIILLHFYSKTYCYANFDQIIIPIDYSFQTSLVSIYGEIGTPKKVKFFFVDLSKEINLVFSNYGYNKEESMTLNILPQQYHMVEDRYKAMLATDYVSMGSHINKRLLFALIDEKIYPKDGISAYIALGRSNKSFVHELQNNQIIKNRRIAFTSKELILGFNQNIETNHHCITVSNGIKWSCKYKGLIICNNLNVDPTKSNTIDTKNHRYYYHSKEEIQLATFETFDKDIIAPSDVLEYFKKYYFIDYIQNNQCYINGTSNINTNAKEEQVFCNKTKIHSFENINFIIGEVLVGLNYSELFTQRDKHDTHVKFRIVFRNNIRDWIFGAGFVKRFHLIFDDEENWVGFPFTKGSFKVNIDKDTENINKNKNNDENNTHGLCIVIYNILIGLMTIGIWIILLSKIYSYR